MRYIFICLISSCLASEPASAQTLDDALRFSFLEVGGTARSVAIGGAIGALGADFSVLSTNPAGLATYRASEFTFTPGIEYATVRAGFEEVGEFSQEDKLKFNFSNIGLVFAQQPLDSKWRTSVFAIGLNRLSAFSENIFYDGITPGSITDRWLELADGIAPEDLDAFEGGLAFDGEAIYDFENDNTYQSDIPPNEPVQKSNRLQRKGAYNELVFSFGGNYADRLMIGATIGVPLVVYEQEKTYRETDPTDAIDVFDDLTYTENLRTDGAGINLKLGLIYRVNQQFRLGFAAHSPTSLGLNDNFSTALTYNYTLNGAEQGQAESAPGNFEYRLRTPWRLIGSAGFIFGKSGFLAAEAEWVDYSSAKFKFKNTDDPSDLDYEQELNDDIRTDLRSALNLRFGGEYAYDVFRLRGGYSILASPYEEGGDAVGALSLGAGIRWEYVFLDLAWRRQVSDFSDVPYLTFDAPESFATGENKRGKFLLTVGFKF